MVLLSKSEIHEKLSEARGWWLQGGETTMLVKDYSFGSEEEARLFADRVTAVAKSLEKQPAIQVEGTQVLLATHTRSEGGVTQRDLAFAKEAEKEAAKSQFTRLPQARAATAGT